VTYRFIVEADDGEIAGNGKAELARGVINAGGHFVVAGEDRSGARRELQQFLRGGDAGFVGVGAVDYVLGWQFDAAIFQACEKSCACTTCHVIVREGFAALEPSDEVEDDLLDKAWGLEPNSRLSCQAIVNDTPLVIEIPRYSINMAKEGKR